MHELVIFFSVQSDRVSQLPDVVYDMPFLYYV